MKVLGLDPGLRATGWGVVVEVPGQGLTRLGCGCIRSSVSDSLPQRLASLYRGLVEILERYCPQEVAVEEAFLNSNPRTTLKLAQARGVVLLVPSLYSVPVFSYAPRTVKKAVVGHGQATKEQVMTMMTRLLPGPSVSSSDASDALAVALCHAHQNRNLLP